MGNSKTIAAANVKVFINGKPFGIATAINWTASVGRHAIFGIDNETPFELAPGQRIIQGRMDVVRIRQSGGLEGAGVMAPDDDIMLEKYIQIVVNDRASDDSILNMPKAAADNQNWVAQSKGVVTGSFSFMGIGWSNDAG